MSEDKPTAVTFLEAAQNHPRFKTLFANSNHTGYICFQDGFIAGGKHASALAEERYKKEIEELRVKILDKAYYISTSPSLVVELDEINEIFKDASSR